MIPAETQYKTHNSELLAIVEAFKTWRYYLEGCKHKIFIFTDYNNFCRFMDTKSLSFRQVRWAQKLSRYHFHINYYQGKANTAADALLRFPQRSQDEKEELQIENSWIFYHLQNSLTSASLASLSSRPSYLHQVLICGTYVLPQLREFWDSLQNKLLDKGLYTASIGGMRLRLHKLGRRRASLEAEGQQAARPARLGGYQRRATIPRPLLCPGNHLNGAHQQAPWRPTSRPFWNWENTRTFFLEILLSNAPPWHWRLREGMQYMPGLKSSPAQAL